MYAEEVTDCSPYPVYRNSLQEYGVDAECCRRCDRAFFSTDCQSLAKCLLGSVLVRRLDNGDLCRGKIVETEAYLGGDDKASHSFNGKKTQRNVAMFMQAGTAYVYSIYGMHHCFNISSDGEGSAVLVRALEPLQGEEYMRERRKRAKNDRDLCNGPAKLCQALAIDLSCNKVDLVSCDSLWVESQQQTTLFTVSDEDIVKRARIGVKYAREWAEKPLRFYIKGNSSVSKR